MSNGWDTSHLRAGLAVTGVLVVVAVPLALWRAGLAGLWGVLVGLAIVAVFFSVSALAVAWAGRIGGDGVTLPAALATYAVKILALGVVLVRTDGTTWLSTTAMAWAVLAGTLCWTAVHARRVWTARLYYVDPAVLDGVGRQPTSDPAVGRAVRRAR